MPTSASPLDGDADRLHRRRCTTGGSSTATRCSASWPSSGWQAARWPATASSCRSCRTAASQTAVEAAGGTIVRTPGGRQVHPRGDAGLRRRAGRREERPRHRPRAHDLGDGIVTALEVLRVMTESGTALADLAAQIPLSRSSSARSRCATRTSGRATGRSRRRSRCAPAPRGGGRILVRPSGTEPALRVMVEGRDAAVVSELADALAALAKSRLTDPGPRLAGA